MDVVRYERPAPAAAEVTRAAAVPAVGRDGRTRLPVAGPRGAVRRDLDSIFRRDYLLVVGVATRVLGSQDQAEDVAQEVFLSFARSSVPAAQAHGWLSLAAAHTALNVLRSGRRRAFREQTATAADHPLVGDVAEAVVTREERSLVRAALARLPRKQAVALVLRHSGLSYADVAAALDMSPGSVGTTVRRAELALPRSWSVMRHPTEGVLRRLLGEPAAVADADRRHVGECPQCLSGLAATREDAALVDAALLSDGTADVDVAAAWQRLCTAEPGVAAPAEMPPRTARWRAVLHRPAVAAAAVAVVLTGAGTAAAHDWLQIFRTEQVAPVSLTPADLVALPDLSAYGDLALTADPEVHEVPDAATAAAQTGLDVPEVVDLPRGVSGEPIHSVGGRAAATFTFSSEEAARAAADAGEPLPPVPPGLDGSSVRLVAGPGVAQIWRSDAGVPALLVGRAVAPTAFSSSGVPFETVRDYLLSLPGLPDGVAAQLRTYTAHGGTLPLPVPADQVTTSTAQVGGVPATVLATHDRTLAAVAWVDDGEVTVVAGSLDADEVLAVARGLR
jgi:RNA polymerase sigma factor (sigma-70 family)